MHILKNIWANWQIISKKIYEGKLGEKLRNGDMYFILLDLFLFVQVFSESQLNELLFVEDLLSVLRIVLLALLAVNAFSSLKLYAVGDISIKMGFVYAFFILSVVNAVFVGGGQSLLCVVFAVMGAKDKPLKRIFKNTLISLTAAHAIVLFLCMVGLLQDNIDVRWLGNQTGAFFQGEYVRHAFGFLNSNQIPLIYMLLLFLYVGIRGEQFTVIETILVALVNSLIFSYCGSRISFVLVFAFLVCFWIARICSSKLKSRLKSRFNWLVVGYVVYPLTFLISLIGSYAYSAGNTFWVAVDLVLNNRLSLANKLLAVYPVSILGYGKYAGTYSGLGNATADNGYVLLFLQTGILLSAMILILHEYIMHICIKKRCASLVICLIFIALENLINAHMPSYKLIPFYCILVNSGDQFLNEYASMSGQKIRFLPELTRLQKKLGLKTINKWKWSEMKEKFRRKHKSHRE